MLCRLQLTHITTLTNGVSFELVAGACCCVRFTNDTSTKNSLSVTLNIQSTGARGINVVAGLYGAAYRMYPKSISVIDWSRSILPQICLLWYDGSVYCFSGIDYYGDYNDAD